MSRRPRLPDFESPQRPQMDWLPPPVESATDMSGMGTFLGQVIGKQIGGGAKPDAPPIAMPTPKISVPEPPLPEPMIQMPEPPMGQTRPRRRFPPPASY